MGDACKVTVRAADVVQPRFAGVGFHVSHHLHKVGREHFEQVIAKRWRELSPSFARLTLEDGRLRNELPGRTLAVYTTACHDQAPSPVRGLTVEADAEGGNRLTWRPNPEPDLCYYSIHRSAEPGFGPSVGNQVGTTVATEFADRRPPPQCQYKLIAVDSSGNASRA